MAKGAEEFLRLLDNTQEYGHGFDVELAGLYVMNDALAVIGKWWLKYGSIIVYPGCRLTIKWAKVQAHHLIWQDKKLIGILTWNGTEIVAHMLVVTKRTGRR